MWRRSSSSKGNERGVVGDQWFRLIPGSGPKCGTAGGWTNWRSKGRCSARSESAGWSFCEEEKEEGYHLGTCRE